MKKISTLLLGFALLAVLGLSSCGSDDCNAEDFGSDVATELQALTDAATLFGTDASNDNCNSYKNAFNDYIDAVSNFSDCASNIANYDALLQQAKDDVNALICN